MNKNFRDFQEIPYFNINNAVEPRFFVNRTEELSIAWKALFRDKLNLLITGPYSIGKSSFLAKIMHDISEQSDLKVLPVWLNMQAYYNGTFENFLSEIIARICTTIATQIYGLNYSEVFEEINRIPDLKQIADKQKRAFLRIYRIVKSKKYGVVRKSTKELGARMVASVKANESTEVSVQLQDLTGYEFLMFIDELNQILNNKGYDRILILCDEANKLSEEINIDIFRRYFEIFASKNIQFIFVTVPRTSNKIPKFSQAFGCHIELKKFPNSNCVEELINLVFENFKKEGGKIIPFEKPCFDKIYEICEGHPYWIQYFCRLIYDNVLDEKHSCINVQFVVNCSIDLFKEVNRFGSSVSTE